MIEKIKERINKNKNEKAPLVEYVKLFSKLSKANELFGSEVNFQKLKQKDVSE